MLPQGSELEASALAAIDEHSREADTLRFWYATVGRPVTTLPEARNLPADLIRRRVKKNPQLEVGERLNYRQKVAILAKDILDLVENVTDAEYHWYRYLAQAGVGSIDVARLQYPGTRRINRERDQIGIAPKELPKVLSHLIRQLQMADVKRLTHAVSNDVLLLSQIEQAQATDSNQVWEWPIVDATEEHVGISLKLSLLEGLVYITADVTDTATGALSAKLEVDKVAKIEQKRATLANRYSLEKIIRAYLAQIDRQFGYVLPDSESTEPLVIELNDVFLDGLQSSDITELEDQEYIVLGGRENDRLQRQQVGDEIWYQTTIVDGVDFLLVKSSHWLNKFMPKVTITREELRERVGKKRKEVLEYAEQALGEYLEMEIHGKPNNFDLDACVEYVSGRIANLELAAKRSGELREFDADHLEQIQQLILSLLAERAIQSYYPQPPKES